MTVLDRIRLIAQRIEKAELNSFAFRLFSQNLISL